MRGPRRRLLAELKVLGLALLLAFGYLAIVTHGFTDRPGWLSAWQVAKLEATR